MILPLLPPPLLVVGPPRCGFCPLLEKSKGYYSYLIILDFFHLFAADAPMTKEINKHHL